MPATMGVAVDATSTAFNEVTTSPATHTNLTVGASLSNGALVFSVTFGHNGGVAPTAVTAHWDSTGSNQLMTSLGSAQTSNTGGTIYLFGLRNPTSGNKTFSVTWTGTAIATMYGISFTGVDQTSDATAFQHRTTAGPTTTAAPTITVTTAVGNIVVAGVTNDNGATDITAWATGGTNLYLDSGGVNSANSALMRAAGAAGTVTCSGTLAASDIWVCNAVDVSQVQAAAAQSIGVVTPRTILTPSQGPSRGLRALRAFPPPPPFWLPTTGADKERLPPIQRAPDESIPFFRPAPGAASRRVPTTGQDVERLPPIGRSPDEATPFFVRSRNPVPTGFYPPTTGADRERLPPIPRSPDEAIPFFRPSQVPVPTRWLPTTGEDVERLPPIQRSPDEATPFFIGATILRPRIWLPQTGEDLERLPPIARFPDESTPFFRPSTAVPISGMAWYKPDADRERPPPISRSPDEAIPFFVRSPVPVPTAWLPQWDGWERPFPIVPDLAGSAFSFKTPQAGTPISGIAWYNWQDRERLPPQARPPDESIPFFVRSPVPVPGILWFKPDEGFRLPPVLGDPYGVQQLPFFIEPPLVPFYAQSNADDFNPLPPVFQADEPRGWTPRTPMVVSTISGIAWYVPGERYQPIPPAPGDGMAVWLPRFVPAVGIAGMAWFNPSGPDGQAFPGSTGSAEDGKSTWTAKTPPPPVGIAGMAWFTPAEQIVRVDPSSLAINQAWGTVFPPNIPPIFVANQFTVSGPGVIDLFDPVTGVNYIFSPTQRRTV